MDLLNSFAKLALCITGLRDGDAQNSCMMYDVVKRVYSKGFFAFLFFFVRMYSYF